MSSTTFNWRFIEQKTVLPGFGLSLGVSVLYISLVILLPLSALFVYVSDMSAAQYWAAVTHPRVLASYRTTLSAAFWSTVLVSLMGLLLAWVLSCYEFFGRRFIDGLIDLPFALPTAVAGLTLATLFAPNGWVGQLLAPLGIKIAFSWYGIVLAMSFTSLPFIVRSVQPLIENLDQSLEEAADTLGATAWQRFHLVVVPILLPGLITGASQAFIRCLGEFGAVIFIAGNSPYQTEVSSLMIFVRLAEYDYASAAAIASVVLAASLLLLFGLQLMQNRIFNKKH
ncbi:sulfate ABC transporter permease subunit CysT [Paenalcaligenes hominis]|uniref:sulfate ABC transporter permease subunit CysT n=1 Tax=Paenalcaligenes hominis TaxID=643674 RepID=UPI0035261346